MGTTAGSIGVVVVEGGAMVLVGGTVDDGATGATAPPR
jgi:hypothetical protein